jgi:hypothetical protein
MRRWVVVTVLVLAVAGCRGRPAPIYEYEPPRTITSTDKPVPQAGPTSTTLLPRAPTWLRGEAR